MRFLQGGNLNLTKPPPSGKIFEFSSVPAYLFLFFGRGFVLRCSCIFFICYSAVKNSCAVGLYFELLTIINFDLCFKGKDLFKQLSSQELVKLKLL